jgi:hypothetical protein
MRHVLNCSVAENSRLSSVELSMCLQNLSPQYGNSSNFWIFFLVLEGGKFLQTESLTNFIKIHSVIWCICKIVKGDYYLHCVCLLGMTWLTIGIFSWHFLRGKSAVKIQVSFRPDQNNSTSHADRLMCIFDHILLSSSYVRTDRESQNTFYFLVTLFSQNRAIDQIMWKNIV